MTSSPARQRARVDDATLRAATGADWDGWLTRLDEWGARDRGHREIAAKLVEWGVEGWWAQTITVGFEQERWGRQPGQRADGTFNASASKTINAPNERVFDLVIDEAQRATWLPDVELTARTMTRPGTARFELPDGSRLSAWLTPKGTEKTLVAISHEKLPDAETMGLRKEFWKTRLTDLKAAAEAQRSL